MAAQKRKRTLRYVARGTDEWQEEPITAITVHESSEDTWSGLYDHRGNELHRVKPPIGYRIR